jgi:dienelactone hydrolase
MNSKTGETSSFKERLPFCFFARKPGILVFLLFLSCGKSGDLPSPLTVTVQTEEGYTIATTIYAPATAKPPGIILLHRYGGDRTLWSHTASVLQQNGILALALDMRGHGESNTKEGNPIHYRQLPEDGWLDALQEVRTAKKLLLDHGADPDNLVVAGEGMGAAIALHYALQDPDMQGAIMLSPGLKSNGIVTSDAISQLNDCPTLLVASEGDAYAATSAAALNQAAPVFSELRTWSGSAHGVDIFVAHPEAITFVVEWLQTIFKGKTVS